MVFLIHPIHKKQIFRYLLKVPDPLYSSYLPFFISTSRLPLSFCPLHVFYLFSFISRIETLRPFTFTFTSPSPSSPSSFSPSSVPSFLPFPMDSVHLTGALHPSKSSSLPPSSAGSDLPPSSLLSRFSFDPSRPFPSVLSTSLPPPSLSLSPPRTSSSFASASSLSQDLKATLPKKRRTTQTRAVWVQLDAFYVSNQYPSVSLFFSLE